MVRWVLAVMLTVATTSVFASAKHHSHSELSGIAAEVLEESTREGFRRSKC